MSKESVLKPADADTDTLVEQMTLNNSPHRGKCPV